MRCSWLRRTLLGLGVGWTLSSMALAAEPVIDFNRDIRPIFSDRCYVCHGPDEAQRAADLRLDTFAGATAETESGSLAIVPHKPDESELLHRVATDDASLRMPPEESGKPPLSAQEVELLRRWIASGAQYQSHWALVKPQRPDVPAVADQDWVRNSIDHFVLQRLEQEGLNPSGEASRIALIRRVTLDLTGLPPTPQQVDAFLADPSPDAYEKVVDRLLASPRYGEHMARHWLDAARYGDTHGLHLDNVRSIWPYRDWVINAFNENQPFDQFTVEQLAGDLLPEPSLAQRVATGFNRCNVTTSEGGSIDEEYYVRYAIDRVETTATVWLGLTAGCAACHDHKFDPLTQKEFYQLFAFFGSLADRPMDGNALLPPPSVQVPTAEQIAQREALKQQIAEVEAEVQTALAKVEYQEPEGETPPSDEPQEHVWIDDELPPGAQKNGPWTFVSATDQPVYSGQTALKHTASGLQQNFFTGASPGLQIGAGDKLFVHVYLDPANPPREIMLQFNNGNWEHRAYWGENVIEWGQNESPSRRPLGALPAAGSWVRLEVTAEQVGLKPGDVINGWAFTQFDGTVYWDKAGIVTRTPQNGQQFTSLALWERVERDKPQSALPADVKNALKVAAGERSPEHTEQIRGYFLRHIYPGTRETFDPLNQKANGLREQLQALEAAIPATLVMQELPQPRDVFMLTRGEYDQKGEKVTPEVPAALPPLPEDAPRNRLGLARWLVSPDNPLTARVTVNRYWQHYFGIGLVKTSEDFGSQGEWPSHPELLDWLATEFVASGWDIKQLQRLIVTSATYRQSSKITPELLRRDPDNRLLARGPRFRLDAEVIRDTALLVSGLMNPQIGGPSVKPYQPPGIWEAVGYTSSNTARFTQDHGDALYRRSMYTFWKRTAPPPTLQAFDAPSRETCVVRRSRTNTPLAALALMNDVQFVEAARHMAQRAMLEGGSTPEKRATFAFRLATSRVPTSEELGVLVDLYQKHLAHYQSDVEAAQKLLAVGESPRNESLETSELAAWTMISNLILNLDETINKW